jgi:hypothetical protein
MSFEASLAPENQALVEWSDKAPPDDLTHKRSHSALHKFVAAS